MSSISTFRVIPGVKAWFGLPIFLIAICTLPTAPQARAQEQLTLQQAVSEALTKNAGLLAERANIAVAEAKIMTARLRPNPVMSASADHLDILGTRFNENNGGGPSEYSARVDFPIERSGKRRLRTEVAQQERATTELQFQDAVRSIALDVATLFVEAQLAEESLNLARENGSYFESIVIVNEARLKAGDIAEVELLRSRLASLQQRNLARQAESRRRAAVLRLQTAIGRAAPSPALQISGVMRRDASLADLEQLRETALRQRPDLLALRQDLLRAEAEVRSQISQAKSDPAVGTEYRRQQGVNGVSNSMGVFLELALPVFNRNQGEIERSRQELRQLELRKRQLEVTIAGELDLAYEQASVAGGLLHELEGGMLMQAQEVRRVTEFSYRRGHVTLLELLDAQRAYNETVQGCIEARAEYARCLYLLDSVSGRTITQ